MTSNYNLEDNRKPLKALLAGHVFEALYAPAEILQRAGFEIDYVCPELGPPDIAGCNRLIFQGTFSDVVSKNVDKYNYDLIILGDDKSLQDILDSDISVAKKLKILPVTCAHNFIHLCSKFSLAEVLWQSGIKTPKFKICHSASEIHNDVKKIGYPIMIKPNKGHGGSGVFECKDEVDLNKLIINLIFPVLLQKKICGHIIDLSGFYQNGTLINFTYSRFLRATTEFGASSIRLFTQVGALHKDVYYELEKIGQSLGACGFVSITAIEDTSTGELFYIEADVRPNVWVDCGKYVGNDTAEAIKKFFTKKINCFVNISINKDYPLNIELSYLIRLPLSKIVLNRLRGFHLYIDNPKFAHWYLRRRIFNSLSPRNMMIHLLVIFSHLLKPYFPEPLFSDVRSFFRKILIRQ
jgi:hypothetical protein